MPGRTKRPGLHRFNRPGHERGPGSRLGVVNRDARTFVQDLDAEDLGRAHRAVLIRAGEGHVEREHLVRVGRQREGVQTVDVRHLRVQLVDGVTNRHAVVANDRGSEQGVRVRRVERELRTDLVHVGDVAALGLVEQVQQCGSALVTAGVPVIVTFVSSISLLSLTEPNRSI